MRRRSTPTYHIDIDRSTCVQCAGCVSICPTRALDMHALELRCHDPQCIGCDLCVRFCPVLALALEERIHSRPLSRRRSRGMPDRDLRGAGTAARRPDS